MAFAARLLIHFLAASPNRSTSCLFSMMLSGTQEITCLCFSHQSPPPPPLVWFFFCMLNFFHAAPTTHDNNPVCQLLRVLHFFCSSPPTVHFFPASFDPVAARLSSLKMRRFKSREQQEKTFCTRVCLKRL